MKKPNEGNKEQKREFERPECGESKEEKASGHRAVQRGDFFDDGLARRILVE